MIKKNNPQNRTQTFFASLDELVADDCIYRKIEEIVDWEIIRSYFIDSYNLNLGRPALDPVIFVKVLLIRFIEGFSSIRKTIDKIYSDFSFRWFLSLSFSEKPPHHSTISNIYVNRIKGTNIFHKIFEYVLGLAIEENLIDTDAIFVDSTHVKANANPHKYLPAYVPEIVSALEEELQQELEIDINEDRKKHDKKPLKEKEIKPLYHTEVLDKIVEIKKTAQALKPEEIADYNRKLEEEKKKDPALQEALKWIKPTSALSNKNHYTLKTPSIVLDGKIVELTYALIPIDLNQYQVKKVSITDPESGWFHKGEHKHVFAYSVQTACDIHGFILSYGVFAGNEHDSKTFLRWDLSDIPMNFLVADAGYKTPKIIHTLLNQDIIPVLPYRRPMTKKDFYRKHEYVYDEYNDSYICPNNQMIPYANTDRKGYRNFKSNPEICQDCPHLGHCTLSQNHQKVLTQHVWDEELELVEDTRYDPAIRFLYSARKETIERAFGDCKNNHGFRFTNYKGLEGMDMVASMTYIALNLLKISRISQMRDKKNKSKDDKKEN